MFGLGVDDTKRMTIVPDCDLELPLDTGGVVFITGPSGGGKSTLLRLIALACEEQGRPVLGFDSLATIPDASLVDLFDAPLEETMSLLAMTGLSDAFVMVRRPCELSDGQRYRLRLAMLIGEAKKNKHRAVVIADEFGAALDRLTAKTISRNIGVWARRSNTTFIGASTHDDLLEALEPQVLIWKGFGPDMEVLTR